MRKPYATRSIAKCVFQGPAKEIPLKIYKKVDPVTGFGLRGHYYHKADMGRIERIARCVECGEEFDAEDIVHGYPVGDEVIELSKDDLDALWQTDEQMRIISCPETSKLGEALLSGQLHTKDLYEVRPYDASYEHAWDEFLFALKQQSQCCYVSFSINHQVRKAIIMPNSCMYTLYYENELRVDRPKLSLVNRKVRLADIQEIGIKIRKRARNVGKNVPKVTLDDVVALVESRTSA